MIPSKPTVAKRGHGDPLFHGFPVNALPKEPKKMVASTLNRTNSRRLEFHILHLPRPSSVDLARLTQLGLPVAGKVLRGRSRWMSKWQSMRAPAARFRRLPSRRKKPDNLGETVNRLDYELVYGKLAGVVHLRKNGVRGEACRLLSAPCNDLAVAHRLACMALMPVGL